MSQNEVGEAVRVCGGTYRCQTDVTMTSEPRCLCRSDGDVVFAVVFAYM